MSSSKRRRGNKILKQTNQIEMRKIFLAIAAIIIMGGAYAQSDSAAKKMDQESTYPDHSGSIVTTPDTGYSKLGTNSSLKQNPNQNHSTNPSMKNNADSVMNQKSTNTYPDGYLFQNGKMVLVKNNKMTPLEKDVTLSNGTVIMKNGSYQKKGGTKTLFRDGEYMDMNGKMVVVNKSGSANQNQDMKTDEKKNMYLVPDTTKCKTCPK